MSTSDTNEPQRLEWRYHPRLLALHLGKQKYSTPVRALGELVANAFDAGAANVEVTVSTNAIEGVESVSLSDDGCGMTRAVLTDRFSYAGVEPIAGRQFARFGVGRFAVFRIGSVSDWTTTARDGGKIIELRFTLRDTQAGDVEINARDLTDDARIGTRIEIHQIVDTGTEEPTEKRIRDGLLAQFCSFLLTHQGKRLIVQGQPLDVEGEIRARQEEDITAGDAGEIQARVRHLHLRTAAEKSRFPGQVLFTAKGRLVSSTEPEDPPSSDYLALVESPYIDSILAANKESLIDLDGGFASLRDATQKAVRGYAVRLRQEETHNFIEHARAQPYYPFRGVAADHVLQAEQALYDVVLEKVHEHVNLSALTKRQQTLVFRLLKRALHDEDLLVVLGEVADLSPDDMQRFRRVLERTTLDSIIHLTTEVTDRLTFLDVLHELVYGDPAKSLKERSQLHKIIEPASWLFGTQYHLATSDKSFRSVIQRHRELAKLGKRSEVDAATVKGINDIPDLFLAAQRDYPTSPKHHHLLVELKAPRVKLGRKEVEQIRRYADTILKSSEFDMSDTTWDLFLVSSAASPEIERDRTQKDKAFGCLWEWNNMRVWAHPWSEIIGRARDELSLVREHLRRKSSELSASEYLQREFPDILKPGPKK